MGVVSKLRSLIDDFRANRLMYKDFSTKLDDLFETLDKQYRFLEQLQLSQLESDSRLKSAERMLKYEAAFKDRIKVDLAKSMNKLESIISKTKQIAWHCMCETSLKEVQRERGALCWEEHLSTNTTKRHNMDARKLLPFPR